MMDRLVLTETHRRKIIQHLEACLPEEGCGMVAGIANTAQMVFPVTNELHSPVRFRMDPVEQLEKMIWIEDRELEILAIFHSHPSGPEIPSETDLAEFAYPGTIMLILSKGSGQWQARGFLVEGSSYREVALVWI